ncbi:hypothetical protein [Rhodococcus marinonascens]|uniref:hypothetical protein n=1 Tax=Rhodococcus marinonascens TaxID=38311 RepID=UPI000ADDA01F|nr:hypothetical protein [Rhodococcus marinonascens]
MNSYRRWPTIAATIALSAGTLLLPGVARAEPSALWTTTVKTTDVKFAVSCWSSNGQYDPFRPRGSRFDDAKTSDWGVKIAAPETVPAGQDLIYTITPDPVDMNRMNPKEQLGPNWIRMKYDIAIPMGVTYQKAELNTDSDSGLRGKIDVTRVGYDGVPNDSGPILRMSVDNITEGTKKDPTGNGPNALAADFNHDNRIGLNAKSGSFIVFPSISITVRAGEAGTVVQPILRSSAAAPADSLSDSYGRPENFFTFQTDYGKNDGKSFMFQKATNNSVRCAPRATPKSSTVNAGGMPLTTIPVVGAVLGSYRTAGPTGSNTCDWTRTDINSNVVERGTSPNSNTVTIEPTDGGFTSTNCAPWTPVNLGSVDSTGQKIPGYNFLGEVGVDLQPGSYLSNGSSDGTKSCLWSRQDSSGNTSNSGTSIANPATVTIEPTDGKFQSMGCGDWTPLSQ